MHRNVDRPARVLACCAAAFIHGLLLAQDDRPWDQQAYLGLGVRDTDDGLVVGWIYPGPLGGTAFTSAVGVQRGDNLDSLNGQAVDAEGFGEAIEALSPGDEVTMVFRRSPQADMNASVPKGGAGGEPFTIRVALSNKDHWSGTITRGLGGRTIDDPQEGEFEAAILERAEKVGIVGPNDGVRALIDNLVGVQEDNLDPNALPAVVQTFRRPLSIDAVEAQLASRFATLKAIKGERGADDLPLIAGLISGVLDLPQAFADAVAQSEADQRDWGAWDKATALVAQMRDDWSIYGEHAADHVRVIRMSMDRAGPLIAAHIERMQDDAYAWEDKVRAEKMLDRDPLADDQIPPDLREAVTGDILAFDRDEAGHYRVLGGAGENGYDMSALASVVDTGGNDRYDYPEAIHLDPAGPTRHQSIIDLGGNDHYEAAGDFYGPATAVFGSSLVDDRAGDDVYVSSGQLSIGAGLFGVGVLIDRAGNDQYENTGAKAGFTMGVGFYGAGLILDLAGSETYIGEKLCQGVGGPRGLGAIVDFAGNDLYRANGTSFGSAYGTPAVYLGMSQGFGYGVRGYAAGGVGAIYDLAGSDQYEAGEFSQAGGYYWGLGVLHDFAGNDLYFGNRYGQAFAAHQAAGILVDDAGDDTYWAKTAASQAGTWDESIGMLIDRAGDDAYRCDGLGQGGASMQAIAVFLDLGGNDRYSANPGAVLGQSGSNTYHYQADGVFSFSCFFDLGGGADIYGGGNHTPARANDTLLSTGSRNEGQPENSSLYGLFADE
ncbi:MAG: hypothetical protein H6810_06455 [Phycisphaeraceae bacterium]|nr:MAG: hypothetical protein H6810_06455 [Phycisphaeraceae bacterium]